MLRQVHFAEDTNMQESNKTHDSVDRKIASNLIDYLLVRMFTNVSVHSFRRSVSYVVPSGGNRFPSGGL